MKPLVVELQQSVLDRTIKCSELLRLALTVAIKLDASEFEHWIRREMKGYQDIGGMPAYRIVRGRLMAENSLGNWVPVHFKESSDIERTVSTVHVAQAVAELEALVAGPDDGQLASPLDSARRETLRKFTGTMSEF